jgi:CRP-like cAMP-binding protein
VKAISYSTLLCLDESRFLRLLDQSPKLREHVEQTANQRKAANAA